MAARDEPVVIQGKQQTEASHRYMHFMLHEAWAGIASLTVYFIFVIVAYIVEIINEKLPLHYKQPAEMLDHTFAWGGALSGASTFTAISLFQLVILIKGLYKDATK